MKNISSVLWGLVLIALGVIVGLNSFDYAHINIFFDGWWTLFIIVPCFIGLFKGNDIKGDLIGLLIGIALLLVFQGVLSFNFVWKISLPIVLVIIGLSFIFHDLFTKKVSNKIEEINKKRNDNKDNDIYVTFAGEKREVKGNFEGAKLSSVFGGIEMDLTNATIKDDVVIDCSSTFGGIDIKVPENVNVVIKSNSIFGGVENKKKNEYNEKNKTIYINATCVFGGVDIK